MKMTQYARVKILMSDGKWRTLAYITQETSDGQSSISAQLRNLRKDGYIIHKRWNKVTKLWEYQLIGHVII